MRNLLSAHFARLWKSRLFWLCAVISMAYGALCLNSWYRYSQILLDMGLSLELDWIQEFTHNIPIYIGVLLAVFISLFLSAEYSDAAIRCKLVVGHSRTNVYFSSLITAAAAALLFCAAYLLPVLTGGAPYLHAAASDFVILWGILALCAAYCAIFTGVSMNLDRRSAAPSACLLGTFVLLFASQAVSRKAGPVYWLLTDVLPFGQAPRYMDVTRLTARQTLSMPLYSCTVAALSTAVGLFLFQRKDIK